MAEVHKFDGCSDNTPPPRFHPAPVAEFAVLQEYNWVVKNIIPRAELAVIFGESGSGKSFLALDLAFHIAQGKEWNGYKVTQGRVVYICAEGANGFRKRCLAYAQHHGLDLEKITNFQIISDTPSFLNTVDAQAIARQIGQADVVFIDTFAQTTSGGNENAGEDVSRALAQINVIHKLTNAMMMLVNHSGKDATKGQRGWSGIKGACDTEIEITRIDKTRKAKLSKQKDGEDGLEWGFKLYPVALGYDSDGDEITSCVYLPAEMPQSEQGAKPRGKWQEYSYAAFNAVYVPTTHSMVKADEIVERVLANTFNDEGKKDRRKEYIFRSLEQLCESNLLVKTGEFLSKP